MIQIDYNQSIISNQNSPSEQVLKARGDLECWNSFCITYLSPVTSVLVFTGAMMLSFVVVKEKNWKLSDFIKIEIIETEQEEKPES